MQILPKKGDLHILAQDWCAICLLDIVSKVLSNVFIYRMQKVQEVVITTMTVHRLLRMQMDRVPRRMLTGWVPNNRPIGAPKMTL